MMSVDWWVSHGYGTFNNPIPLDASGHLKMIAYQKALGSRDEGTMRTLEQIVEEIKTTFGPLPYDVEIEVDHLTDNLLVSSRHADLGFCITRKSIADGLHMRHFPASLLGLKRAMANKYYAMACALWPEMAQTTDDFAKRWQEAFGGPMPVKTEDSPLVIEQILQQQSSETSETIPASPETAEERKARIWAAIYSTAKGT